MIKKYIAAIFLLFVAVATLANAGDKQPLTVANGAIRLVGPGDTLVADTVRTTGAVTVGSTLNMTTHQINGVATPTLGPDAANKAYVDSAAGVIAVTNYGVLCNGTTDDSAAVLAALSAARTAGGATLMFPVGTCRIDSQILIPNDGAAIPTQVPIRITGQGPHMSGRGVAPTGGTILDLRYAGVDGKITTFGQGYLEIDHVTLKETTAATTTPFVYDTNTTLHIHDVAAFGYATKATTTCDQDFIVLGGTTTTINGADTSPFQGYGTVIANNYTDRLRRFAYLRTYANGIQIVNNTVWANSGSNLVGGAAVELDGMLDNDSGNYLAGNLIEMVGYPYAFKLTKAVQNTFEGNNLYDAGAVVPLAYFRFEATATFNWVRHGFANDTTALVSDASGGANTVLTAHQSQVSTWSQPWTFTNPTVLVNNGVNTSVITQNTSGDQAWDTLSATTHGQRVFEYKPSAGAVQNVADLWAVSASDVRFDLQGTTNNRVAATNGGQLQVFSAPGQALFLGDSTAASEYALNGVFYNTAAGIAAKFTNTGIIGWSGTTAAGGGADVGLTRNAAGVLEVNNGTAGALSDVTARNATFYGTVQVPTLDSMLVVRDAETNISLAGLTLIHDWDPFGGGAATPIVYATADPADTVIDGIAKPSYAVCAGAIALHRLPRLRIAQSATNHGKIILANGEGSTSLAANQIWIQTNNAVGLSINHRGVVELEYDCLNGHWRMVGPTGSAWDGMLAFSDSLTDTALAATVNDYSPALFGYVSMMRLGPAGGLSTITGMKALPDSGGKIQPIRCVTAFGTLVFSHNSASSLAGNRFFFPETRDLTLRAYQSACFRYDQGLSYWTIWTAPPLAVAAYSANAIVKWNNQDEVTTSSISDTGTVVSTTSSISANGGLTIANQYTFLGRQVFSITGTYTPTTGARVVRIRECGGGGGSGGAKSAATGGGSSGSYLEVTINPGAAITGGVVTIGAAGTAGALTPTAGGNGGDTSVVVQATTYTAKGGGGSIAGSGNVVLGAAGQTGSSAGDINQTGNPGTFGAVIAGTYVSGNGGSSPFGSGGVGVRLTAGATAGNPGLDACAGASGGADFAGAGIAGAAGSKGSVIIEEWK
jgi:hypothetical protein